MKCEDIQFSLPLFADDDLPAAEKFSLEAHLAQWAREIAPGRARPPPPPTIAAAVEEQTAATAEIARSAPLTVPRATVSAHMTVRVVTATVPRAAAIVATARKAIAPAALPAASRGSLRSSPPSRK